MRRLVTILTVSIFVCLLVQALPGTSWAQSGKLAGTVTDGATGETIPGATVILEGTTQGTATGATGQYFLIGVNPGTYTVRFSFVGYGTKVVENVLVTSDRTKTLDMTLESEVVAGSEIVVEAVRPVVDANQTTSRTLVTSDEISRLPVRSLSDVINKTSNSYNGYLRGSRRYETKTVLEGVDVSDAWYSVATAGGYGGNVYHNTNKTDKTSPSLFDINPDAVSEVAVNTGATEAKYASGTGGVVSVSLSEGRGPIHGSFSARVAPSIARPGPDTLDFYREKVPQTGGGSITMEEAYINIKNNLQTLAAGGDAVAAERLKLYTWDWDDYCSGGGTPGNRDNCGASDKPEMDFRGNIGGSITENWHFSANARYFDSHGFMPNEFDRAISGQFKSTYQISDKTSLTAVGVIEDKGLWGSWNNTDFRDFFRFNLESVAQNDGGSYLGTLKLTQVMNDHSFLDVQVYRHYWRDRYGYPDDDGNGFTDPGEDGDFIDFFDYSDGDGNGIPDVAETYVDVTDSHNKMFTDQISDPFGDSGLFLPNGLRYRLGQPVVYSEDTKSVANGVKVDYTNQINHNHFIQVGAEGKFRTIDYQQAYGVDGLGFTLNGELEPWIPNDWSVSPKEFSLYASDRMEYAGLIINLGLRVEAFDRDLQLITDHYFPFMRDTVNIQGTDLARNFWRRGDDVDMDIFLNPSVGVSHPIGENAAMYFSYKRAKQLVPYQQLYTLNDGNNSTSRFFNYIDPEIDPIVSDNYELGVQWEFSPGWGADVNAYMRAVENFGVAGIFGNNRTPDGEASLAGMTQYTFLTDFGYADARGIEIVLRRAPLQLTDDVRLGLTGSYTFSTVEAAAATGINTTGFNSTGDSDTELPFDNAEDFQHFPVDVRGGSRIESGFDRRHRFVLRSSAQFPYDVSLGLNATFESGFLYSPAVVEDERDRALLTGPSNNQVDLRVEKQFTFNDRFGLDVYFDVTNLLDRDNVIAYDTNVNGPGPFVFQETGVPGQRLVNSDDGQVLYGPARNIYFGTRVRF